MKEKLQSITASRDSEKTLFNVFFKSITDSLIIPIRTLPGVVMPSEKEKIFLLPALWDTAANNSHITKSAAFKLGLITKEELDLCNGKTDNLNNKEVLITLWLPDGLVLPVSALIADDIPDAGLIIGMNIICKGNFQYSAKNGKSVMSFAMPLQQFPLPKFSGNHHPVLTSYDDRDDCSIIQLGYDGIVDRLQFLVKIASYDVSSGKRCDYKISATCIIDTGAICSFITQKFTNELKLLSNKVNYSNVQFPDIVVISVYFTDTYCIEIPVKVTNEYENQGFDFALGMDVLASGALGIINYDNLTRVILELKANPFEGL